MTQKLYALHTTAPYSVARTIAISIAMDAGYMAELSETPDGATITVPRRYWGTARWWGVFVILVGAPFVFRWLPSLNSLQGFGIGWASASILLLTRRTP